MQATPWPRSPSPPPSLLKSSVSELISCIARYLSPRCSSQPCPCMQARSPRLWGQRRQRRRHPMHPWQQVRCTVPPLHETRPAAACSAPSSSVLHLWPAMTQLTLVHECWHAQPKPRSKLLHRPRRPPPVPPQQLSSRSLHLLLPLRPPPLQFPLPSRLQQVPRLPCLDVSWKEMVGWHASCTLNATFWFWPCLVQLSLRSCKGKRRLWLDSRYRRLKLRPPSARLGRCRQQPYLRGCLPG